MLINKILAVGLIFQSTSTLKNRKIAVAIKGICSSMSSTCEESRVSPKYMESDALEEVTPGAGELLV